MKKILLIFLVAGCAPSKYLHVTDEVVSYGFSKYENQDVTCYVYRDADSNSMSCKWKKQ